MTKTTTNVIGIIIVILAGIYFYVSYCGTCARDNENVAMLRIDDTILLAINTETSNAFKASSTVRKTKFETIFN